MLPPEQFRGLATKNLTDEVKRYLFAHGMDECIGEYFEVSNLLRPSHNPNNTIIFANFHDGTSYPAAVKCWSMKPHRAATSQASRVLWSCGMVISR